MCVLFSGKQPGRGRVDVFIGKGLRHGLNCNLRARQEAEFRDRAGGKRLGKVR